MPGPIRTLAQYLNERHAAAAPAYNAMGWGDAIYGIATDRIFELLCLSPTFRACIVEPQGLPTRIQVMWDELHEDDGADFSIGRMLIRLNSRMGNGLGTSAIAPLAAHEYRHAWQASRGILGRVFDRFAQARYATTMLEADAVAFHITVGFEMCMHLGREDIGRMGDLLGRIFPECTDAFYDEFDRDSGSVLTGAAQNAVIRAWRRTGTESGLYDADTETMFRRAHSMGPQGYQHLRQTAPNADMLDQYLFSMPYCRPDGTVAQRPTYGRFTQVERQHMMQPNSVRQRIQESRLNAWTAARAKPRPKQA